MNEEILKTERQFIYLLLNSKDIIGEWIDSSLKIEHFHPEFHLILTAILDSYDKNVLLTRRAFSSFVGKLKTPKEQVAQEVILNNCLISKLDQNNFPLLLTQIREDYLKRNTTTSIKTFVKDIDEKGITKGFSDLVDNLNKLVDDAYVTNAKYEDITDIADREIAHIEGVRDGTIEEPEKIVCGIKEIDEIMVTGFEAGTLTLFCADVGDYKSTVMLNIGLNIWKQGYNVLFVPIEQSFTQSWKRAISRESKVPSSNLFNVKSGMTDEDMVKIKEVTKKWKESENKFYMLEIPGAITVSAIKRQIERKLIVFKPIIVIIDYIALMEPERRRVGRNDLEIGDMLKLLRRTGRDLGFAVVSGAQIGRETLRKIKNSGNSQNKTPLFDSTSIRGSHEYSADADNIFAQIRNTAQPESLLDIFVVKSRNGPKTFEGGYTKASLEIVPEIFLVKSQEDFSSVPDDGTLDELFEAEESFTPPEGGVFFDEFSSDLEI